MVSTKQFYINFNARVLFKWSAFVPKATVAAETFQARNFVAKSRRRLAEFGRMRVASNGNQNVAHLFMMFVEHRSRCARKRPVPARFLFGSADAANPATSKFSI